MAVITTKKKATSISSRLVNMTPYQVYVSQVQGVMDTIRYARQGMAYTPPQFGGISGQRDAITEKVVLQVITFEAGNGT